MSDIETALRASLAEHARHAPAGATLAEQIIAETQHTTPVEPRRGRQWRTWTLPLIAAGSVVAVVAALAGLGAVHHGAGPQPAAPAPSATPAPSAPSAASAASAPSTGAPQPSSGSTAITSTGLGLTHFQVIDMTFVGAQNGWALGTADCLDGSGKPCAAMVRTTDGGATWRSMRQPAGAGVPLLTCTDACIRSIRFATTTIGYAFGDSALFMTNDGGATWTRQPGGADALETLNGNVIRLVSDHSGCPGPCNLQVKLAPVGSSTWTAVTLPGGVIDTGLATLTRSGSAATIETSAGQAGSMHSVWLYTSADDGKSWTKRPDPCTTAGAAAVGAPQASQSITSGADGSISLLCGGVNGAKGVTVTSTDAGATFRAGTPFQFGCCAVIGAASASVLVVISDQSERSADGGHTWRPIGDTALRAGNLTFIGFESTQVGRVATDAGRTILTTHDAGRTWSAFTFPGS